MVRAETIQADVEMTLRHPAEAAMVCDMLNTSVTPPFTYFTLSITSPITHFRLDLAACGLPLRPRTRATPVFAAWMHSRPGKHAKGLFLFSLNKGSSHSCVRAVYKKGIYYEKVSVFIP